MRPFALDICEAKKLGIRQWQENFFWPVPDTEFFTIVDAVAEAFLKELESQDRMIQDILLASAGLVRQCAAFVHALLVIDRLTQQGHTVRCSEQSEFFRDILNRRSYEHGGIIRAMAGGGAGYGHTVKGLAKFLLLNRFTPGRVLRSLKTRERVVSLGTFSRLKKEYCKKEGILFHRSSIDYLSENGKKDSGDNALLEACVREISAGVVRVAEGLNLPMDDFSRAYLRDLILGQVGSSCSLYRDVLNRAMRKTNRVLLSEVGKAANKTICFALKRRFGTEIVGFEHGNTFGSLVSKYFSVRELAHCDKYVVSTTGSIQNFEENRKVSKFPCGVETKIVAVDSDYYLSLWKKNRRTALPRKIRRVMLMGFPMDPYRYPELPGHFSLFHLDLELRLMAFLKERGLRVIYKAHPDRAKEVEGVFEGLADEVCFDPFERVSDKGDAILFSHTDTSTFGIALCGPKPIIVIEMEGKIWNRDPFRLISKRCRMVPGRIDGRNRITFDERLLEECLAEEITNPNTEFLEQFMFPGA
ncbi:MAG: hypothetical protein JW821_00240 [Deltaproteobacteria bacterium]|nr:hypothetical protein [Deltaproteobacteria bacterium]